MSETERAGVGRALTEAERDELADLMRSGGWRVLEPRAGQ